MNTFYLVRHAEVVWEPDENRPLSERGFRDARRVADVLQEFPITVIYSSPYLRARQTIAELSSGLDIGVNIENDLRERRLSSEPGADFFKAVEMTWEDFSFAHPGGESNSSVQKRGVACISSINQQYDSEHIVISTHGNLLAIMLNHFDRTVDFNFWKAMTLPDIFELTFKPGESALFRRLWG